MNRLISVFILLFLINLASCTSNKINTPVESNAGNDNNQLIAEEVAEEEYQLPIENVFQYKKYTVEDLIKKAGANPGVMDHDIMPIVIKFPGYPKSAFLEGKEGEVKAEFTVASEKSHIQQIKILSSTDPRFEADVLVTLKKWQFSPAKIKTVRFTITNVVTTLQYKIENGKPVCYVRDENGNKGFYPPLGYHTEFDHNETFYQFGDLNRDGIVSKEEKEKIIETLRGIPGVTVTEVKKSDGDEK
jgi:TonB family protein